MKFLKISKLLTLSNVSKIIPAYSSRMQDILLRAQDVEHLTDEQFVGLVFATMLCSG